MPANTASASCSPATTTSSRRNGPKGFGSEPDADIGFLKTAYPANADLAGARRVPIRDGQDAIRIDITMLPARAANISGRVITADGLAAANVMLVLQSVDSGPGSGLGSDTRSGSDGSFCCRA